MADSLKLAVATVLACLLARTGWLESLGGPGATAAFLLYFTWPMLALLGTFLTAVFATRDHRDGLEGQAVVAVPLSLSVLAFSWTTFHGFDQ